MNTTSILFASGALLLGLGATSATAQTTGKPVEPHAPMQGSPSTKTTDTSMPASSMNAMSMTPARASKLIGTNIVDSTGKDIAEIKDLMICPNGEVTACVERKDDMYTCVPLSHLEPRFTKSDEPEAKAKADEKAGEKALNGETPNIKVFAFTGDRALFDSAPGVKDMKMVDGTCMKRSMDHFSGKTGEMKDDSKPSGDMASAKVPCAKKIIGQDVKGTDGSKIGDIKDLAIDLHNNKVAYAIVSTGGVLGVGDKLHAVAFDRITCTEDACTVPMTKDGISALPAIDIDRLPNSTASAMPSHDMPKGG